MIIVSNDYFKDMMEQEIGQKPIDKVEVELSAGVWTDITDYYVGGATFDQEKERAPDKISAGDTTYTFDNTEDTFTPKDASSIFYNVIYIGKKIRFSEGFYGIGTYSQSVMFIKDVDWDYDEQKVYIYCQELMQRLVEETFNAFPSALIAVANAGNTGNGTITEIATLPFAVGSENWTLTCTTLGGSGVGKFNLTGSVSGDLGDDIVTSNTEYINSTVGVTFTVNAGGVAWAIGDIFTFTTYQYPEYTTENPVKMAWNLITGYAYDTDVQSDWHDRVLELDHTQSTDNTDIDYDSFVNAIADVTVLLTGYIPYDKKASEAIEEIIIHFLGSIYTDRKGRIAISAWRPSLGPLIQREFSDEKQVFKMNGGEKTSKIINKVTVYCKSSASFAWSDDDETTDDVYVSEDATSITDYGVRNPFVYTDFWYSASKLAQAWFADRITDKFGNPPLEISFDTGLDGLRTNLADRRRFTDSRTSYDNQELEIIQVKRDFESEYKTISFTGSDTGTTGLRWAFLGSSVDEGDGQSPQASSWDSATESDKSFCYLSTTGSGVDPRYYLWGD